MPTVCASVPMQAPSTTSLRRSRALDGGVDLLGAQQRVLALHDVDGVEVDQVVHLP